MDTTQNSSSEENVKHDTNESLNQLTELVKLRDTGVINETEFNIMKKRIIGNN